MTVLMRDNAAELEPLLRMSAEAGVGHCATLLSTRGFRRAAGAELPSPDEAGAYAVQWNEHPHFRMFGDYIERIPAFLAGAAMPECRAGVQSFNIDHVGNVSHCIEKIDRPFGNVRRESPDRHSPAHGRNRIRPAAARTAGRPAAASTRRSPRAVLPRRGAIWRCACDRSDALLPDRQGDGAHAGRIGDAASSAPR